MQLEITAIPAYQDNYIWALHDPSTGPDCVLVDPGEAAPALNWLRANNRKPIAILLTHHHHDHIGGVEELSHHYDFRIFGPDDARIPQRNQAVGEGDRVAINEMGLTFNVLEVPAHTRSHIAFYGHDLLFSGDTLFSAGCGRLFEGTPAQMQAAMDKIAALPGHTRVYCGHEYSQSNCRFALQVEPDNPQLIERARAVDGLRAQNQITLPTTLADELSFNPFMRTREPAVIRAAHQFDSDIDGTPASVLGAIRRWKDSM